MRYICSNLPTLMRPRRREMVTSVSAQEGLNPNCKHFEDVRLE